MIVSILFIVLFLLYLAFFGCSFYIMLEKLDDSILVPILLSLIPLFNMIYVFWAESNKIKESFKKIFTKEE